MPNLQLDSKNAKNYLPKRPNNANKGTFGKVLLITGSQTYRGAALLSCEAALRSGVGYVYYASEAELSDFVLSRFPEIIVRSYAPYMCEELSLFSKEMGATLFGPGSGNTAETKKTALALLSTDGGSLILDADALNAMALDAKSLLSSSKRPVLITPHPGEFSRLLGLSVAQIESNRIFHAQQFAKETGAVVLLKGNETVVTNGADVYLNHTGDTALAKAGSGDVLAGLIAGLCASGADLFHAAALGAYLHGKAGQTLGLTLSPYGVTASDLPTAIAKEILALTEE